MKPAKNYGPLTVDQLSHTEARAADGDFFGEAWLAAALSRRATLPLRGLLDGLIDDVVAFQDGSALDDIAVLILRRPVERSKDAVTLKSGGR